MQTTIYIMTSVAMMTISGVVLINGCSRKIGNRLAIASLVVAVFGIALLLI